MIFKPRLIVFSLLLFCANPASYIQAKTLSVTSPDKAITFTITDETRLPTYSVSFKGKTVIQASQLGMTFQNAAPLMDQFRITSDQQTDVDETWQQPWGETKIIRDHHHQLIVNLQHHSDPKRHYSIEVRVFNDGLGFRYHIPKPAALDTLLITDELTEFSIADFANAQAWWIPGHGWRRYEHLYRQTTFNAIDRANTPFTVKLDNDIHMSIHEAALLDYPAMSLDQRQDGTFKADLTPWSDGIKGKMNADFKTPWRTIQLSDRAVGLLNSHLILNLNEPNKLGDISWVKPGKYIGIWWGIHLGIYTWNQGENHGATTENTKRYIDFAAHYGFDGVLVEGWNVGWDNQPFDFTRAVEDFNLRQVTDYAKDKGVKLIGHHETWGNASAYRQQMSVAFDRYQKLGVTQVKTGYVGEGGNIQRVDEQGLMKLEWHDGQYMVNEYLHSVLEAAKRHISINTHEPVKDTGLRRTYPNWISREGARGQEFNVWGNPTNPPEHTVNLVYTRMLAGPMDFTPGIFNLAYHVQGKDKRVSTTLAKQLALYIVLYSPIQMAADLPENYLKRLEAFQFIRDVATDWQQSIALAGEVGDFVVFARQVRDSSDWFVGAITDENTREIEVNFNFLDKNQTYLAQIYRDGEKADWENNPYDLVIEEKKVSQQDRMTFRLATSGGLAIRLQKVAN